LDKRKDLIEFLRFADSTQSCFNSKNYKIKALGVRTAEWIIRSWKDPLSYVFQIEDSPGNAIGFAFGGFGEAAGAPIVLLNMLEMEGKTDTAARSVANLIEQDFTRPLGCNMQMIATRNEDTSTFGTDYSNETTTLTRLRALQGEDGNPQSIIYDDLKVAPNSEKTTNENVWHKEIR
jgi:predicted phage tail protein